MIHYHGMPLTPVESLIKSMVAKHMMVSFAHPEQVDVCVEIGQSVVLDNGAFSTWKSGKPYDFRGYEEWAARWTKHPAVDWCVIPDVIDGSEEDNDQLLMYWPLPKYISVPVYHMHESLERLRTMIAEYPRVALGSSGEYAVVGDGKWWARMAQMMAIACDGEGWPRCKLHGLRMLNPGVFSKLPFASADSCNVSRNIGIDKKWKAQTYLPVSKATKAMIIAERIEQHASAARWDLESIDAYHNDGLLG